VIGRIGNLKESENSNHHRLSKSIVPESGRKIFILDPYGKEIVSFKTAKYEYINEAIALQVGKPDKNTL